MEKASGTDACIQDTTQDTLLEPIPTPGSSDLARGVVFDSETLKSSISAKFLVLPDHTVRCFCHMLSLYHVFSLSQTGRKVTMCLRRNVGNVECSEFLRPCRIAANIRAISFCTRQARDQVCGVSSKTPSRSRQTCGHSRACLLYTSPSPRDRG